MKNARLVAFATTAALVFGSWTGTAGALLESDLPYGVATDGVSTGETADERAVAWISDRLLSEEIRVVVTPGGDVSVPSVLGGFVQPPPPPPIVRQLLARVGYTLGVEGEVEVSIGRNGGDVSAPSVLGGFVQPPPPPPVVRYLLERLDEMLPAGVADTFVIRVTAVDRTAAQTYSSAGIRSATDSQTAAVHYS